VAPEVLSAGHQEGESPKPWRVPRRRAEGGSQKAGQGSSACGARNRPAEHRKATKLEAVTRHTNNFEAVAREWFEKQKPRWAVSHSTRLIRLLERDVFRFRNLGAKHPSPN